MFQFLCIRPRVSKRLRPTRCQIWPWAITTADNTCMNRPDTKSLDHVSRLRFLIADDHPIFAEAIGLLLGKEFEVIGIVNDGRALMVEAERLSPDVIIV